MQGGKIETIPRDDIDELLHASLKRVEATGRPARPVEELVAAALAAIPADGKVERLTMPRHARAAASIAYMVETDDLETDSYEIFVDPYTAKVKVLKPVREEGGGCG